MAAGDPLWGSVVLAMHMDDAGLTDATGKAVTLANGNVSRSGLAYAPLTGNAYSALFASTGRLNLAQNAEFNLTADFTVEAWIYPTTSASIAFIIGLGTYGQASWALHLESLVPRVKYDSNGDSTQTGASGPVMSLNTWSHVAAVRSGNVWTVFTNGVAGTPETHAVTLFTSSNGPTIGSSDNNYHFVGNLNDLRVTKGVSRYTANFTPPTAPFLTVLPSESITASLALPPFSSAMFSGASIPIRLPALSVPIFGGVSSVLSLPSLSIDAIGHGSTGEQAADISLPSLTSAAQGGANATISLPSFTSQAAGTVTTAASANITLTSLNATASATASEVASANITLPSFRSISYAGALCSVTIGKLTAQATGTTGSVGRAQITLPLFQATAIATAQNHGSVGITLPSLSMGATVRAAISLPGLTLTAIGSATITATYEAYAVNLKHSDPNANDETTHYTNFPFTHVVRYQNSYYGANSTGLYLLEGSTDDGTPIPWAVQTAMTDFKTPNKKTLAAAYFSGRLGPASTISLIEGEHTPSVYSFTTPRGTLAQNHRQKFGKGTKGRYYALSASGTGTCELDGIEPEVHQLTRRI